MTAYSATLPGAENGITETATHGAISERTLKGRPVSVLQYPGSKTVQCVEEQVSDLLPLALHALSRYPEYESSPLFMLHCDFADKKANDDARLTGFLQQHEGESLVWMPVAANASLLISALKQVLPSKSDSRLRDMTLLYVGDAGLREVLQQLAEKCGMKFCFQAFY
ncbi:MULTISPECIES: hypothetical protein [Thalassolituus]|uniref:hypothetical protein n=1 Tax=Thalassolituus TaxID=187492 RepID=UPI000C4542CA|nr:MULTISPECIES: hypothetical protein [Thalassolituus]MAX85586.1 hypothetical protein [Oceanospirillaceae bacterium]|tara:strand:- start:620 stop:1120 length:501 start_codon:yes stop_codon:yes gene_type:complete